MHISRRIADRVDEFAESIAREGGKPLKWSKVEVTRAISTFRWASEESRRMNGEFLSLDTEQSLGSRAGIVRRFAYGPVLGISPFNFPVNLVAHKIAPALAVGAPIVVKPAGVTPLGALALAELVDETDLPKGMLSVLPISGDRTQKLVEDRRFKKLSFTGSGIGWRLKSLDPHKHATLFKRHACEERRAAFKELHGQRSGAPCPLVQEPPQVHPVPEADKGDRRQRGGPA